MSGQPAADHVVDRLRARPGQPSVPERADLRRLRDTDRQEVWLDQQDRPAGPHARDKIRDRRRRIGHVMQHGARGDEVEAGGLHRTSEDVPLTELHVRARAYRRATGRDRPQRPLRRASCARRATPRSSRSRTQPQALAFPAGRRVVRGTDGASGRAAVTSAPAGPARPPGDDRGRSRTRRSQLTPRPSLAGR